MESTPFILEKGLINRKEFILKLLSANLPLVGKYVTDYETKEKIYIEYYNIPAAFDIETSSFIQNGEKKANMYIWQFGILNWVTTGRTWEEYITFINVLTKVLSLSEKRILTVYIQNLPYEWQFIRKRFPWDKVFLLEERKPVYAICNGIQYKCSLKLSSKSLENMAKDLQKYHVKKMVGDLDYSLIRTSKTPLTEEEYGYCENDIRVLLAYIQEKIEQDGDITKIPLTNTGYVRRYCREECEKDFKKYHALMSLLTLEVDEYSQLKRGFMGGFVHASAKYSHKTLRNVGSYDFTSSYPAVMLLEKFPMSKGKLITENLSDEQLKFYMAHYCCIFDVTFYDISASNSYDHPISSSKCYKDTLQNAVIDNGRIVMAEQLTTTITEQDYLIYEEFYTWSRVEIQNFRIYQKGYLPKRFYLAILELYRRKTELKGVDGEEVNYMIWKNMLNSTYGMSVTDIIRDIFSYDEDKYSVIKVKQNQEKMQEQIDKYNESVKRFLFYPWGLWVTAYARRNLFSGILACGSDYVYADTDSIKILNPERHKKYIEWYNSNIMKKIKKAAEFHGISEDAYSPKNKYGKPKTIGLWDYEGKYDIFKTIGAKRYIYYKDGKWGLTMSGVSKKLAMQYLEENFDDPAKAFNQKLVIPSSHSGRLTLTYCDEEISGTVVDYNGVPGEYNELSYIHMEPSDYELDESPEYKKYLMIFYGLKEDSW